MPPPQLAFRPLPRLDLPPQISGPMPVVQLEDILGENRENVPPPGLPLPVAGHGRRNGGRGRQGRGRGLQNVQQGRGRRRRGQIFPHPDTDTDDTDDARNSDSDSDLGAVAHNPEAQPVPQVAEPNDVHDDANDHSRCQICRDEGSVLDQAIVPCGHCLCSNCRGGLRERRCPFCRTAIRGWQRVMSRDGMCLNCDVRRVSYAARHCGHSACDNCSHNGSAAECPRCDTYVDWLRIFLS